MAYDLIAGKQTRRDFALGSAMGAVGSPTGAEKLAGKIPFALAMIGAFIVGHALSDATCTARPHPYTLKTFGPGYRSRKKHV